MTSTPSGQEHANCRLRSEAAGLRDCPAANCLMDPNRYVGCLRYAAFFSFEGALRRSEGV